MVHGVADLFVNKRNGHGKLMKRLPPIGGGGGGPAGGGGAGTGTGTGTGTGGGAGGGAGGKGDPAPDPTTSKVTASAPPSPPPSKPTDDPTTTKAPPPPPPKTTTTKAAPPPQTTTSSTPSSTATSTSSTPAVVPTIPPPVVLPTDSGILPPSTMAGYTPPFALTSDNGFTLNPSPTDTSALPSESASSSGSSTGSIVGIVAAAIAGVVVVGAAVSWVIRRKMKRGRRGDGFDSDEFLRNSVMIPDDMAERSAPMGTQNALSIARANANNGPSRTPRPPSTIERHVAASRNHQAPPLPSMNPGQFAPQDDFFSASYGSPDEYGQGGRNLTSVTPYQQEQYAAISRQLDFGQQPADYPPSSELQRQPSGSEHAHYGYAYSPEPSSHHLPNPHDGAGPFTDDHGMAPPPVLMAGRHPADTGRSGTPVMANPQQAYRAPHGGYPELSNQATPSRANIVNMPPTAAAHHGEVGFVGGHHGADDDDDAYGGI